MTTSAAKSGEEGLASLSMEEEEKVAFGNGPEPSSSEGAGIMRVALQSEAPEGFQEGGTPDCSSSHQVKTGNTIAQGSSVIGLRLPKSLGNCS